MKKLFVLLLFIVFGIFANIAPTKATHLMGSDIVWKCLGKDTYLVTVTVYRDCNGAVLQATNIEMNACGGKTKTTLSSKFLEGKDITPVCKKSCTRCGKKPNTYQGNPGCTFLFGIEEFKYQTIVNFNRAPTKLSSTCCDVTFSWANCCRNSNITTGAADQGFWVGATLNRCAPKCDNSPYFSKKPVAIFCIKQCISFNMGVNDDDVDENGNADSLVYSVAAPLQAERTKNTYRNPYKFDKPMKYDGFPNNYKKSDFNPPNCKGFFVDSATGDINFMATQKDNTVLAVQVQSWGKDASGKPVLKAVTRRDIQIILIDCKNNRIPTLSGINGGTSQDFEICAGQKKCFTINSYDPDSMDTVSVEWNNAISGATFEVEKNKKHPVSTFCWQPGADKVRNYPYQFVTSAQDDACDVNGRTAKSFRIRVRPSPDPIITTDKIGCGTILYTAAPRSGSITKYSWEGDDGLYGYTAKVKKHYRRGGKYKYILNTENSFGCVRRDSGTVTIDPYVFIDLPRDSVFCQGDTSIVNIPSLRTGGTGPFGYKWNTTSGDTDAAALTNINIYKDSVFVITVYDTKEKCNNYDTIKYIIKLPYKPSLGPDLRSCFNSPVKIGDSFISQNKLSFSWYKNTQGNFLSNDSNIIVTDSANYILATVDSVGCKTSDTLNVAYNPSVDIVKNIFRGCKGDRITMGSGATDSNALFVWKLIAKNGNQVNPPQIVNTKMFYSKVPDTDEDYIITSYQNKFGVICSDSDTVRLIIKPKPKIKVYPIFPVCVNSSPIDLIQYVDLFGGLWSAKDTSKRASVVNNKFYPNKAKIGVNILHYYYFNPASGCDTLLIFNVIVDPLPIVNAGFDSVVCPGDTSSLNLYDLGAFPTSGGFWTGAGIFNNNFIKKSDPSIGSGKKLYIYEFIDNSKLSACRNSDTVQITFVPDFYPNLSQIGDFCATDANTEVQATPLESDIFVHKYFVTDKNTGANLDFALSKDGFGNTIFSPSTAIASVAKGVDIEAQMVVEISNKGNCAKYDTINFFIYAKPEPTFNMSRTEFCISEGAVQLVATETSGRRLFKSPAGKNYVVGNYFNTNVAGVGTHRVNYTYFDNSKGVSCPADTHIMLTVFDVPKITVGVKTACENEPFELTADTTNAGSITWVPFDPTAVVVSQGRAKTLFYPGVNDLIVGKFRVMARASKTPSTSFCKDDSVISVVTIPSKPKISFEADPLKGCEPLIVNFTDNTDFGNSLPMGYEWDFGDGTGSIERNPSHAYVFDRAQSKFTVTLKVRSAGNCLDTLIKPDLINVYPVPVADFVATPRFTTISLPVVRFEDRTDYKDPRLQDSSFLVWSFGDGKTMAGRGDTTKALDHEYKDTGVYTVSLRVRNQYGCPDTIIKSGYIDIRPEILVFIPNVFTPNNRYNDKTLANEQFLPIVNDVGSFNLQIFSRWGEFMFESNDQTKGWDGLFKGKPCQDDAYVYVLKVTSLTGKKYKYTGSVTLIR